MEMKENMDDGEIDLSNLPNPDSSRNIRASFSEDSSFLDNLSRINAQVCTHTHICNPPGPDAPHTHTCHHTHTNFIPSSDDIALHEKRTPVSKPSSRPLGNREAVRKYREKKKAQEAYLEEEVRKLRDANKLLVAKLQRGPVLETEVLRLRRLLVEIRGKIDGELGDFPFGKKCRSGKSTMN
ncbi:hypothetical protein ABFS82_14G170000 [Erythranthe guttata]|nr:PREDICTED: uncharacterized protein LOC105951737 [Erythranthe guttata]|eukprot:XP_012830642.1 PREDICTED: uncharacterized protein LOC105951737 [Erythranthe guttata]